MPADFTECPCCEGAEGREVNGEWLVCECCEGLGGHWKDDDHAGGFGVTMIDDYGQKPKDHPQAEGGGGSDE